MDSSKASNSRKETYTHKNIDPKISTIGTMYIHHNNIHNSPKINSKLKPKHREDSYKNQNSLMLAV